MGLLPAPSCVNRLPVTSCAGTGATTRQDVTGNRLPATSCAETCAATQQHVTGNRLPATRCAETRAGTQGNATGDRSTQGRAGRGTRDPSRGTRFAGNRLTGNRWTERENDAWCKYFAQCNTKTSSRILQPRPRNSHRSTSSGSWQRRRHLLDWGRTCQEMK